MKRDKVVISKKAQESIKKIFDYVKRESNSLETAQKVRISLINRCKSLKDFSGYSKEKYLEGDFRSVTQWDYNIIYKVTKAEVRILNIIHTSQHPDYRQDI